MEKNKAMAIIKNFHSDLYDIRTRAAAMRCGDVCDILTDRIIALETAMDSLKKSPGQ